MELDEMIDELGNEKPKKFCSRQRKMTPMVLINQFSYLDSLPADGKQPRRSEHI